MYLPSLLTFVAHWSTANAVYKGFNYGATKSDGYAIRVQSDFQSLFHTAKNLVGTSGFSSARLYTTVQAGTASDPTSAIPAAIAENTSLLLGFWASAGQDVMNNEIKALKTAIAQYGTSFTNLVVGISVGSEDLYRISPIGVAAKSGYGAEPSTIAEYIKQVRSAVSGTPLVSTPIGHVDTWTAWVNGSNKPVIDASDWIGMDAYPYFQDTQANGIENGASLFNQALTNTKNAVGGKPVWITETGWPVSGSKSGSAETGNANAKTYWDQVGCPMFGAVNTWWFTLEDTDITTPNPSFGIVSGTTPRFDLSCSKSGSGSISTVGNTSDLKPTGAVISSGSALTPTVGNGIRNNSGSGSAPNGLSGTNSSTRPSGTLPSGTQPISSTISSSTFPSPTQNSALVLSSSAVGAVVVLFAAMVL
ncbi:putative glucan endo-1,3-beta-glucosidase eglC [Golovinomyces cichoracearum]|uniref:Probable glucan endo-1,3-beta-glucosidase eglC n=1 Tax=Golovinomyces cichoracearum TaxID=62708 RepID=A0A420IFT5_9PEZI|nr:putative glucan endo-1,3-beta-glucosidase eglC [Golovinomyces cichoracearum]